jgi:hypothetical protein
MTDVFVFGSNRAGIHGAGAALFARKHHGAIYGQGEGLQGQSYAIPTKSTPYTSLSLDEIADGIVRFIEFALSRPDLTFNVTPVGCGYAGYTREQIKPLFEGYGPLPRNCRYSPEWTA